MGDLYAGVVGQEKAVAVLTAAAARPVHAYLFVGPPGAGKGAAARSFAAALLCPANQAGEGPDGTCDSCRRVLAGVHPDVIDVEREGAAISIDTAREVTRLASTSPFEATRKVLVLHDFHLVKDAGPALLKTFEEPPPSTVFVILADHVPADLITIASRCVQVDFHPLTAAEVAAVLERRGVDRARAEELAVASGGRLDRAWLLANDAGFEARRAAWREIPGRLDGTGATAAAIADESSPCWTRQSSPSEPGTRRSELLSRNATPRAWRSPAEAAREPEGGRSRPCSTAASASWRTASGGASPAAHGRTAGGPGHARSGVPGPAGARPGWRQPPEPPTVAVCVEGCRPYRQAGPGPAIQPGRALQLQALLARLGRLEV